MTVLGLNVYFTYSKLFGCQHMVISVAQGSRRGMSQLGPESTVLLVPWENLEWVWTQRLLTSAWQMRAGDIGRGVGSLPSVENAEVKD